MCACGVLSCFQLRKFSDILNRNSTPEVLKIYFTVFLFFIISTRIIYIDQIVVLSSLEQFQICSVSILHLDNRYIHYLILKRQIFSVATLSFTGLGGHYVHGFRPYECMATAHLRLAYFNTLT